MVEQLFKNENPQLEGPANEPENASANTSSRDEQSSSRVVDWIVKNQKTFAATFAIVLLLAIFAVWQVSTKNAQRTKDFEQAHFLAQDLEKNSFAISDDDESSRKNIIQQLTVLNDKYPDLHKRYDGIIAQEYILDQNESKIDPYAKRAIDQLQSVGLQYFANFSEISRLVAKNKLDEARSMAQALNTALKENATSKTFALRAYTLLQLVALNKKLGSDQEAQSMLQEARALLQESPTVLLTDEEKEIAQKIRQDLEKENGSLLDFL